MNNKILVVGPIPPPYHGCSVMNNYLLSSYLTKQFNIIFLDISDRRDIKNIGVLDIKNICFAFYHGIKFIYYMFHYNPDLIYISISQVFWGYLRDLLFLFSSRLIDKKILIHLHGGAFHEFYKSMPWLLAKLTRYIFKGRVWGIVLDENLKTCFDGLIESERIYSVPNGIKDISFRRESNQAKNGTIHILYLSNLMKSKGFMELFKVVPEVVMHYPNLIFTFAGEKTEDSEMEKVDAMITNYKLEKYVKMPGVVKGREKEKLLAESDIFVFPPIAQEGQPLVILEAMAAGLPVISTDCGAIRETVQDGITGFVIPSGDSEALLEKLLLLIKDEKLRRNMGLKGEKRFQNYYRLERWTSDLQQVFKSVLEYKYL